MTDNEIIKAMQCVIGNDVSCSECTYQKVLPFPSCRMMCAKNALDLINRQKAEIEWLEKNIDGLNIFTTNHIKVIRLQAIKEFTKKVDEVLERYSHIHENAEGARKDFVEAVDGTEIEMQSVWDVHTLIANEMGSDTEEMYRLQDNIETIAKERLLAELEKDFRLLVKEMTE